jgi:hypothetical protein
VKLVLALVIFSIALVARKRQRNVSPTGNQRSLLPLMHLVGALALAEVAIAVLW